MIQTKILTKKMANKVCIKFTVNGYVQGVCYRSGAQRAANGLNVYGYAKNLRDGDVEVVACGDEHSIEEFEKWLARGPSIADVLDIRKEVIDKEDLDDAFTQFEIY